MQMFHALLSDSEQGWNSQEHVINAFYRPQTKLREGNVFTPVCHSVHGGGGVFQHAPKPHYISSCTGVDTQLVLGQHTGNIKCMMG